MKMMKIYLFCTWKPSDAPAAFIWKIFPKEMGTILLSPPKKFIKILCNPEYSVHFAQKAFEKHLKVENCWRSEDE
jgi:hypothetical protein